MFFNKIFNVILIVVTIDTIFAKADDTNSNKAFIKKCYDELGCVEFGSEFYNSAIRPKNLVPFERHTIGTLFTLFSLCESNEKNELSNINRLAYEDISASTEFINSSKYVKGKDLKLLIHDFTSHGYTGWIKNLAMVFLKNNVGNVISVQWESGAEPPLLQAVSNARVVALEIKLFLNVLMDKFMLKPSQIHMIGHGLGAHIAGYASKKIPGIKQITGLDPTGPYFDGMPFPVRLSDKDASLVEVIHTDKDPNSKKSQGIKSPVGHLDYYVNNGECQPGCNDSEDIGDITSLVFGSLKQDSIYPACSHKRAYKYYLESLTSKTCDFIGILCPSYKELKQGNCTQCVDSNGSILCYKIGERQFSKKRKALQLFLSTGPTKPYCRNPYVIKISLGSNTRKIITGYFDMIIFGKRKEDVTEFLFNNDEYARDLEHGNTYKFLAYGSVTRITSIQKLKLKWTNTASALCIKCIDTAYIVQLMVTSLIIPNSVKTISGINYFCPVHEKVSEYKSGIFYEFINCNDKPRLLALLA